MIVPGLTGAVAGAGLSVRLLSFQKFMTGTVNAASDMGAHNGNIVAIGVTRSDGTAIATPTGWTSVDKDNVDGGLSGDELAIAGFYRELTGGSNDNLAITGTVLIFAWVISGRTGARALSVFSGDVDASTGDPNGNTVSGTGQTGPMLIVGWGGSRSDVTAAILSYTGATADGQLDQITGTPEGAAKYNFYPTGAGADITVDMPDPGGTSATGVGSFGILL